MMHTTTTLYSELAQAHIEVSRQIEAAHADFKKQQEQWPHMADLSIYNMKTRDGQFVLTPLLTMRAQLLAGMASLKAADMQQRTKR